MGGDLTCTRLAELSSGRTIRSDNATVPSGVPSSGRVVLPTVSARQPWRVCDM